MDGLVFKIQGWQFYNLNGKNNSYSMAILNYGVFYRLEWVGAPYGNTLFTPGKNQSVPGVVPHWEMSTRAGSQRSIEGSVG